MVYFDKTPFPTKEPSMKTTLFLLALTPTLAFARPLPELKRAEAKYEKCMEEASSTLAENECILSADKASNKLLNRSYQAILKRLRSKEGDEYSERYNAEALRRLEKSQKAWLAYRDADCALSGIQMFEGSGEGVIQGACRVTETFLRTKALEDLLGGGDREE